MKKTLLTIIISAIIAAAVTAAAFMFSTAKKPGETCTHCGAGSVIVPNGYSHGVCPDCGAFIEM